MSRTRVVTGAGWRLTMPETLSARAATPAPDGPATSVWLVRGWLGEAPLELVVTTQPRRGTTLRKRTRELIRWFDRADAPDGVEIAVAGAQSARRAAGDIAVDDDHERERVVAVVAAGRHELVVAVARTALDDGAAHHAVDGLLASLELLPGVRRQPI